MIVFCGAVEGSMRVELLVEQPNAAFDGRAACVQPFDQHGCQRKFGVAFWDGMKPDTLLVQFRAYSGIRLVSAVTDERAFEGGFQQGVDTVDIMPVAGKLNEARDHSPGRDNQVLAYAVEVHFLRGAVACFRQTVQTLFFAGANRPADGHGVGVDGEKRGWPSPAKLQNAPQSFSIKSVSNARRSANFWRLMRCGKRARMRALFSSQ